MGVWRIGRQTEEGALGGLRWVWCGEGEVRWIGNVGVCMYVCLSCLSVCFISVSDLLNYEVVSVRKKVGGYL